MELTGLENARQIEQAKLDILKSARQRNELGQFATPQPLALSLAQYAHHMHGTKPVRFLDPALGTGAFYSALRHTFSRHMIEDALGIEIDPAFSSSAQGLWAREGLRVVNADFTLETPSGDRTLIIANPPYVRHQHLSQIYKKHLESRLRTSLNMRLSGLAGLYCFFLLLSHDWLEANGLSIWLIPSEFMDVNYGDTLRRYLIERVTLLHVHRFDPTQVQFDDALVSSSVVVFRKSLPPSNHQVRFSFGGGLKSPQAEVLVNAEELKMSLKWSRWPGKAIKEAKSEWTLGDFFEIKRGIATGCNGYFILTKSRVEVLGISLSHIKPILPSPRHVHTDVIRADTNGLPLLERELFVIDSRKNMIELKREDPNLYAYLEAGARESVDSAYLPSRRSPWFSQEKREPAPFLCTYMGRSRNGKHPFRFIWNQSRAIAHNVYLMLYPKKDLAIALLEDPSLYGKVFDALCLIDADEFAAEGRVYGGGLFKVEPKELGKLPAEAIYKLLKDVQAKPQQWSLFLNGSNHELTLNEAVQAS